MGFAQSSKSESDFSLVLAGQPLETPYFHVTGWKVGQTFTQEEDPDRTLQPWEPPTFAIIKDPIAQRAKTVVEELPIHADHLRSRKSNNSFARIVHGVLDEEDCAELLACVNTKGFTPALVNIGHGRQRLVLEKRNGQRVIVDSPELSVWLLEVLRPYLPAQHAGAELVDLNERCRFLRYTPGQYFAPHRDGRYARPAGHPHVGDCSMVTVQVYLHDVPCEVGGATTFLHDNGHPIWAFQPSAGSVLIFTQNLRHEASLLQAGIKYTLRTEAMYRQHLPQDPRPKPIS